MGWSWRDGACDEGITYPTLVLPNEPTRSFQETGTLLYMCLQYISSVLTQLHYHLVADLCLSFLLQLFYSLDPIALHHLPFFIILKIDLIVSFQRGSISHLESTTILSCVAQ